MPHFRGLGQKSKVSTPGVYPLRIDTLATEANGDSFEAVEVLGGQSGEDRVLPSLQFRQQCHLQHLCCAVLIIHSLKLGRARLGEDDCQLGEGGQQLIAGVQAVVLQAAVPHTHVTIWNEDEEREEEATGCHQGGRQGGHGVVNLCKLDDVIGEGVMLYIHVSGLEIFEYLLRK